MWGRGERALRQESGVAFTCSTRKSSRNVIICLPLFKMTRSAAFLAVAVLLCIILSAEASDVLRCTGERQRDGQFYFNMSHGLQEDVDDCETQWVINGSVAGISNADENKFIPPLVMATANTALLQTCPEKLECLLICPSASINTREQCSCDITSPTTLPEEYLLCSTEESHTVGFPGRIHGAGIGVSASVILLVCVTIVLYKKKKGYAPGRAEETV
ncbi:uncharacterized protein LOC107723528 [Sinocyclocheilus rhinocerous]|uniref:uncharacterized protein LOC107723528 n=1 Tax=Sinocyclocheilus rhinocerous TaxID=307959 RepID=UPI0007B808D5|nr:PREDICTED: uncharacterized protein LOC107723528 [Sinocyclocheilus rhinocerous]